MSDLIHDIPSFTSAVAAAGQTVFAFPFKLYSPTDLVVTVNNVLMTYSATPVGSTQYNIAIDTVEGGYISFGSGRTLNDAVAMMRNTKIERVTQFPNSGPVPMSDINLEFDRHIAMIQERRDQSDGSQAAQAAIVAASAAFSALQSKAAADADALAAHANRLQADASAAAAALAAATVAAYPYTAPPAVPAGVAVSSQYWMQSADNSQLLAYKNVAGVATPVAGLGPIPLGPDATIGLVLPYLPTPADVFARFDVNRYLNIGKPFLTIANWLASATGSFTRAGTNGTYTGSDGLTKFAAANAPRFTYDETTLLPLGLYNEASTSNLWNYSNKGYALGASSWLFSITGVTVPADNNATGSDGTMSGFQIRETATTGLHQDFYYPGAGGAVTVGQAYAAQFRFKPIGGRTKYQIGVNAATGMPAGTFDLATLSGTNGYSVQARADGFFNVRCKFTGAGSGSDIAYFVFSICDASGATSYLGDITKGCDVDNIMLSPIASLASPYPSMIYRPDNTAATRAADALAVTVPLGDTKMSFSFGDNTTQTITVVPGVVAVPTNLNSNIIRMLISIDLAVAQIPITAWAGLGGPSITPLQAHITGLKTTDTPTFLGLVTTNKAISLGGSIVQIDGPLTLYAPSTAVGWTNADRAGIFGRAQARPATFSNSQMFGIDCCANAIGIGSIVATTFAAGDTAMAGALTVQGVVAIGNEAGNGNVGASISGGNVIGNATNMLGSAGNSSKFDIMGQLASRFMRAIDTVCIGWSAGTGNTATKGSHTQTVLVGSQAGSLMVGDRTGNIIIGFNIQAPTTTSDNYISIGDAFRYNGVNSKLLLSTPALGKAKIIFTGYAASTSYANDAAAAAGGVGIDELYRNGSVMQVRVT